MALLASREGRINLWSWTNAPHEDDIWHMAVALVLPWDEAWGKELSTHAPGAATVP